MTDSVRTSYTIPEKGIYYLFYYAVWSSSGSYSDLMLNGKRICGSIIINNSGSQWLFCTVIANKGDVITCSTGSQFRMVSYQKLP